MIDYEMHSRSPEPVQPVRLSSSQLRGLTHEQLMQNPLYAELYSERSGSTNESSLSRMATPTAQYSRASSYMSPPVATPSLVDVRLKKEDYPHIKFWTRQDFTVYQKTFETSSKVQNHYLEREDGTLIDEETLKNVRKEIRAFLNQNPGFPPKLTQCGTDQKRALLQVIYNECPDIRLCQSNWKGERIAGTTINSSTNTGKRREKGKASKLMANGDHEDEDADEEWVDDEEPAQPICTKRKRKGSVVKSQSVKQAQPTKRPRKEVPRPTSSYSTASSQRAGSAMETSEYDPRSPSEDRQVSVTDGKRKASLLATDPRQFSPPPQARSLKQEHQSPTEPLGYLHDHERYLPPISTSRSPQPMAGPSSIPTAYLPPRPSIRGFPYPPSTTDAPLSLYPPAPVPAEGPSAMRARTDAATPAALALPLPASAASSNGANGFRNKLSRFLGDHPASAFSRII
ncbi:hypothetical protein CPC08DRAFT_124035 [Agrocybe pediades]|nr:hypothetical protein CPC08DRAFT_124035 [Agrocybe pediades]